MPLRGSAPDHDGTKTGDSPTSSPQKPQKTTSDHFLPLLHTIGMHYPQCKRNQWRRTGKTSFYDKQLTKGGEKTHKQEGDKPTQINKVRGLSRNTLKHQIFLIYQEGVTEKKGRMSSPVSRVLSGATIHLGPALPQASSDLPESSAGRTVGLLFGLAPGGVCHRRGLLPATRCALTAPFHPYPITAVTGRYPFCCTFRRLAPPRRYLAPCPMEPGLSSPWPPRRASKAAIAQRAQARQYDVHRRDARNQAKLAVS
ncbi:hypothetical protein C8D92_10118 [Tamilnaduibacter salinus]|uniref:Uncharacterized protein n=1 Tax=Tamilnaduibacter salinus TaxID=1484056 RepID=A0A2U1D0A6_9GAMM|nr:hypothetical protein C8D92_10118 [Tamilnaduibacter salinus]